jgi:hypothetical protein
VKRQLPAIESRSTAKLIGPVITKLVGRSCLLIECADKDGRWQDRNRPFAVKYEKWEYLWLKGRFVDRELVTMAYLNTVLTDAINKIEGCHGTSIRVQYRLQAPDDDGCNWSETCVPIIGLHTTTDVVPHVNRLIADARKRFNIQD